MWCGTLDAAFSLSGNLRLLVYCSAFLFRLLAVKYSGVVVALRTTWIVLRRSSSLLMLGKSQVPVIWPVWWVGCSTQIVSSHFQITNWIFVPNCSILLSLICKPFTEFWFCWFHHLKCRVVKFLILGFHDQLQFSVHSCQCWVVSTVSFHLLWFVWPC